MFPAPAVVSLGKQKIGPDDRRSKPVDRHQRIMESAHEIPAGKRNEQPAIGILCRSSVESGVNDQLVE
jgi:hypothetical protein